MIGKKKKQKKKKKTKNKKTKNKPKQKQSKKYSQKITTNHHSTIIDIFKSDKKDFSRIDLCLSLFAIDRQQYTQKINNQFIP